MANLKDLRLPSLHEKENEVEAIEEKIEKVEKKNKIKRLKGKK